MRNSLVKASRYLSLILRHEPERIGLSLDSEGWVEIDRLIEAAAGNGHAYTLDMLHELVETNDKKRFAISEDGLKIRAVQGHSNKDVNIAYEIKQPPALLYHGTARRFLPSILQGGLRPGGRQYVHLSPDAETAVTVGKRHGEPVVLTVQSQRMAEEGNVFHQADNGVWLTKLVPKEYIDVMRLPSEEVVQ